MRRLLTLLVASLMLLATAACGSGSTATKPKSHAATGDTISGLRVSGSFGAQPKVKVDPAVKVDKPVTEVISEGSGSAVQSGKKAMFDMYVARGSDGRKIYSSIDQGTPTQTTVQATQGDRLSKVVSDALVGKPRGSRVAVAAPVSDVFGAQGAPQYQLKAKDSVVFVLDVLSVEPTDVLSGPQGRHVSPPSSAPVVKTSGSSGDKVTGLDFSKAPAKAPKKLTVIPLVKGTGPKAQAGRLVTFNYYGAVWGSNKPFDSSFSRGAPVPFGVGVHGLIPAWDKTIPGLRRGSRVLIIAPPKDAYGTHAQQGIPANSTLVFVVDVLGVDS